MVIKLLPPSIETKLPAQIGNMLNIPYLHNRSVSGGDYKKFILKIKTISTDIETTLYSNSQDEAEFNLTEEIQLTVGQFYKAQLAYVAQDDTIGYYSTVGIFKYTEEPTLAITVNGLEITGTYNASEQDISEKVYSYYFEIYDQETEKLLESSGVLLHNSSLDTESNQSQDAYVCKSILNGSYNIKYSIITNNGLQASITQNIEQLFTRVGDENNFIAVPDNETGAIYLKSFSGLFPPFQIMRSCGSKDNWEILTANNLPTILPHNPDYTVEQGIPYIYRCFGTIPESSEKAYIESQPTIVDFEDIFLYDGVRQLKIKFNPKVSSFKNTILENKVETIGGRYPFVFRNGHTNYKEFQLSGLISYHMDNENLFMLNNELNLNNSSQRERTSSKQIDSVKLYSTNLTGENIATERQFKIAVLNWLTDGKPKLLKSPTEGNYIVRLTNVSLSPEETLGRMLHSFSCTAYEVAEYNGANLIKYGFTDNLAQWRVNNSDVL